MSSGGLAMDARRIRAKADCLGHLRIAASTLHWEESAEACICGARGAGGEAMRHEAGCLRVEVDALSRKIREQMDGEVIE